MENIEEVKQAIADATHGYDSIEMKIDDDGINISPARQDTCIFSVTLEKILIVAKYFNANVYIDFEQNRIRLH